MMKIYVSLLAILCLAAPMTLSAQAKKPAAQAVDIGAFATETMVMVSKANTTQLAMWYPFEFYVETNMDGTAERASVEQKLAYLKPYLTIIVQTSVDQEDGASVYSSEKAVKARAALVAADGSHILPMAKPPAMVAATVAAMKEIMASEGDAGSANLHVLVFPNKGKDGKPLVDATHKGKLKLVLAGDSKYPEAVFIWNAPFDALVTAPPCTKCKERLSAKWSFCPWCGEKAAEK